MPLENITPELDKLAERYVEEAKLHCPEIQSQFGPINAKTFVLGFSKYMEAWSYPKK